MPQPEESGTDQTREENDLIGASLTVSSRTHRTRGGHRLAQHMQRAPVLAESAVEETSSDSHKCSGVTNFLT
jgi:hypothetical protein